MTRRPSAPRLWGWRRDEYYHALCRLADELESERLSGMSKKCLAFDKNGKAFVNLMVTIRIANAGRLWEVGGAAQLVR